MMEAALPCAWPEAEMSETPQVVSRQRTKISPWVTVIERGIRFPGAATIDPYHAFEQAETVGIVALAPDGTIPIVQQFRPAIERFVWEFPAGMIDAGETAEACCRRELEEEVGLKARHVIDMGSGWPDTARLSYRHHCFFVAETELVGNFVEEPGTRVAFVTLQDLYRAIQRGDFPHQLHAALLLQCMLNGLLPAPN